MMLSKIRFRTCLYKLILLRNIIENKVHREKMSLLFSFEQLIINTEEAQEEEELRAQEEEQQKIRQEIMRITGSQNPSTSAFILQKLLSQQEMRMVLSFTTWRTKNLKITSLMTRPL